MRKKFPSAILFMIMLLSLIGIIVLSITRFDDMKSVFTASTAYDFSVAVQTYVSLALLLLCWAVSFVFFIRLHNNGSFRKYGRIDLMTGIGNINELEFNYSKTNLNFEKRLAVAYIAFDSGKISGHYGLVMNERLQKGAAQILASNSTEYDAAARVEDGVYAMVIRCDDGAIVEKRVSDIIAKLNKYQYRLLLENSNPFRAGIYIVPNDNLPFKRAFEFSKTGYRYACDTNNPTLVFSEELLEKDEIRSNLKRKLTNAIDNNEFEMFLQFVYSTNENKFVGAEALSRWNSPEDGFVMPAFYINDMRTSGVIEKFDMYMLEKTCALLEKWSNDSQFKDLLISCNITRITISSESFIKNFRNIVKKYKFNHNLLILEITEDALIDNKAIAYQNIVACKSEGFQIALDDFGAGSTSLSDMSNYPIDQLKVDRQLVSQITTERGAALLHGLVQLAHKLDIKVVCEGIETQKQVDAVIETCCDYIQGYYYSYVFSIEEGRMHYLDSLQNGIRQS